MSTISPKSVCLLFATIAISAATTKAQNLPSNEAEAIEYLSEKGVEIKKDANGHATRLVSYGKARLSVEEWQLIGLLTHVEQMGLNEAPLADDEWEFLKALPKLKSLSIWHGKKFATLEPFSGLPVESLTIGGCMGLRDLNKDDPNRLRNAIVTLHDLPNLKHGNWYHSPLIPDDSHLAHIAEHFPKLENLRLDFAAPRGSQTTISPAGLTSLQRLPLRVLSIENAGSFGIEHLRSIAGIKSLECLLVDARRTQAPLVGIKVFRELRGDVEVVVAGADAKGPPRPTKGLKQ